MKRLHVHLHVDDLARSVDFYSRLLATEPARLEGDYARWIGQTMPGPVRAIGRMELARVNLPVGLLIWVMIIPMLLKADFGSLSQVRQHWRGIGVTLFVNWAVKPFSMALPGWLFVRHVFAPYLPAGQADSSSSEIPDGAGRRSRWQAAW
jgi:catechol 2,3-dioxygenase-like lactoylglutathione lyase family enzyme